MISQITYPLVNNQEISLSDRRAAIETLVKAREEKHITLLEFGWVSGVSWDAVRSWVQGRREPTMGNLVAVAQTLDVQSREFLVWVYRQRLRRAYGTGTPWQCHNDGGGASSNTR